MQFRPLKAYVVAALTASATVTPAYASDVGAAIAGAILGGVIVNEASKNKKRSTATSSQYSATRAYNRESQTALNYFGFNAGTPDGVLGSRSRTAVSQYQAYVGFAVTGNLSQYERDFLVSSYNRAQVGGPQVIKAMQTNQDGVRSLLTTWYDEVTGTRSTGSTYAGMPVAVSAAIDEVAESSDPSAEQLLQRSGFIQLADLNGDGKTDYIVDTSVSGSSFWCGAQNCTVMVFASTPQGFQRSDFLTHDATPAMFSCHQAVCRLNETPNTQLAVAPAPQAAAPQEPVTVAASGHRADTAETGLSGLALFNTAPAQPAAPSLASHCSKVSLLTSSNGGFATVSNITDPDLALSEQFCLARTYSISTGEQIVSGLQGVTPQQVDQQCDSFGPVLAPYVQKLALSDAAGLISEVQSFVLQSNMSIEQLAGTAKICLFSGYRRDNMEVALGSALLMVGLGQKPYAELVGHHLEHGFGIGADASKSTGWYMTAIDALAAGAEPVVAPGQPERVELLRAALSSANGDTAAPQPTAAALPSFNLEN